MSDLIILCLLCYFLAIFVPILNKYIGNLVGYLIAALALYIFLIAFSHLHDISIGNPVIFKLSWVETLNINFSFYLDGLSLLFTLIISGVGFLIFIYSATYLKYHHHRGRFFTYMLMFMASMLGLVLSSNLITLYIFWELTSVTSFLLIGFNHSDRKARRGAFQALIITNIGGLCLLAASAIIYKTTSQIEIYQLLNSLSFNQDNPYYLAVMLLIIVAAFTKSAQFPLHFWLPNAMSAPMPVSAYLHSATMVKAGVYLLMRFNPILGTSTLWSILLVTFGALTLLAGIILALRETDMKLMLAYSTVSSLGFLVLLTGVGTELAVTGAIIYLFAHSCFKGSLFLATGCVEKATGHRDIILLSGLIKDIPIAAGTILLAACSLAGIPPFLGYVAKEKILESLLVSTQPEYMVTLIVVSLASMLTVTLGLILFVKPFLGKKSSSIVNADIQESRVLWLPPMILAILGLISAPLVVYGNQLFFSSVVSSIINKRSDVHLAFISEHMEPLVLSFVIIVAGAIIFTKSEQLRRAIDHSLTAFGWGPDKGFDQAYSALLSFSNWITRLLQNGLLSSYFRVTFIIMSLVIFVPLFYYDNLPLMPKFESLRLSELGIIIVMVAGAIAIIYVDTWLKSVLLLGVQGTGVALLFMLFGAPDLSFTQFMVEILTVVILALVIYHLRINETDDRTIFKKTIDGVISIVLGCAIGLILLATTQTTLDLSLSEFFYENSYKYGHGNNIVNVILVNFRALDTLGEIMVVMIAGLSALILLHLKFHKIAEHNDVDEHVDESQDIANMQADVRSDIMGGMSTELKENKE